MRKNFESQLSLTLVPVSEVDVNLKSRDELPPVLKALQYIYVNAELRSQVFSILEQSISVGTEKMGRPAMDRWEVFVMAIVRLCLNTNYDRLQDLVNNHITIRGILGVRPTDHTVGKQYSYQTILDNVSLLSEDVLIQINQIVVEAGHSILKKKRGPQKKKQKSDPYK